MHFHMMCHFSIENPSNQQNNFQPIRSFLLWQDPTHQPLKAVVLSAQVQVVQLLLWL